MRNRGKKARMPRRSSGGGLTLRPLWIIARHKNKRMEMLTIDPDNDRGSLLAVFSFEEEAQTFLGLLEDDEKKKGWSIRETAPGELISILLAPCADARGVALDPLPPLAFLKAMLPVVSVNRELFVRYLMEERKERSGELVLG
jgi:hypothetical protein